MVSLKRSYFSLTFTWFFVGHKFSSDSYIQHLSLCVSCKNFAFVNWPCKGSLKGILMPIWKIVYQRIYILTPCNFWALGTLVNEDIGLLSQLILTLVFLCEKKTKIISCFLRWKHLIILYLIHDTILIMHYYKKAVKNWFSVAHKLQWIYFLKKGWCTTIVSVDIYSNFTILLVNLKISWWDV